MPDKTNSMNISSDDRDLNNVRPRAARIKLLLMDVDGVLTDGRLINVPAPDGRIFETKAFDSQDGIALQWLSWHGIATGVISGRESPATVERARQVKMTYVYQGHIEKIPILEEILAKSGITPEETIAVCETLVQSGITMIEVPLNSPRPIDSIRAAAPDTCSIQRSPVLSTPMRVCSSAAIRAGKPR